MAFASDARTNAPGPKGLPMRTFVARTGKLLQLVLAGLLFGSYLSPWVSPHTFVPLAMLAIAFPHLVLCNLVWLAYRTLRRQPWALVSLAPLLPALLYLPSYLGLHPFARPAVNGIRVMTFNAKYFDVLRFSDEARKLHSAEGVATFLLDQNPDILCTQEFTGDGRVDVLIQDTLIKRLRLTRTKGSLAISDIYSRFPILAEHTERFAESSNAFTYVDLQLPNRRLRVYNLHLQSYGITVDKGERSGFWEVLHHLHAGLRRRALQAQQAADSIAQSPYPVVVCGDLNDVPLSYVYRVVSHGLQEALRTWGWGWGFSYSGPIPLIRIDYMFCSPGLRLTDFRFHREPFSQHQPATALLDEGQ
jgi:endonuclease/exonuclease/phosphatase family metal-dependent hydrolase